MLRVSNSLDSDQDRHCVGPDLGPNCLQKLLQARKELNMITRSTLALIEGYSIALFNQSFS